MNAACEEQGYGQGSLENEVMDAALATARTPSYLLQTVITATTTASLAASPGAVPESPVVRSQYFLESQYMLQSLCVDILEENFYSLQMLRHPGFGVWPFSLTT
jgi:hypothetical protein